MSGPHEYAWRLDRPAGRHVRVNARACSADARLVLEEDQFLNPRGVRAIGALGTADSGCVVASTVRDATGIRVRRCPIRPDATVPPDTRILR